jgi:hypothetical protein
VIFRNKDADATSPRGLSGKKAELVRSLIVLGVLVVVGGGSALVVHLRTPKHAPSSYSITPPPGWKKIQPTPKGTLGGYAAATTDSDGGSKLKPYITIQRAKLLTPPPANITLAQVRDAYLSQLEHTYANFQGQTAAPEDIGGAPAVLVVFSSTTGNAQVTTGSLYMIKDNTSYAVNGETLTSTWLQHSAEIQKSLLTFRPLP